MLPIHIQIVGDKPLLAGFDKLESSFSNLQSLIEKVGVEGLKDTQRRFDVGGPGWPQHAESTRRQKFGPSRLLWDSGDLRGSFEKDAPQNIFRVDARSGVFGSSVFYGVFHQEGRGHNPLRVIVNPEEHEAKYQEFFVEGMNERIREAGFTVS